MISLIAAIQKKGRGIGFKNELLFRISDDLKRFKALTTGHPIIMGRKTFDSIGKPLPNRTNIVVTHNPALHIEGITFCSSTEEALEKARALDTEIFVIGGGEIYNQALPFADQLHLTIVDADFPADTFFPDYSDFSIVSSEEKHADEKSGLEYSFVTLAR